MTRTITEEAIPGQVPPCPACNGTGIARPRRNIFQQARDGLRYFGNAVHQRSE
jgi:hypothetical protein